MYSEGDKLKPLRDKYGMPVHKDLNWLWRPIRFTAPQCDLVRRDGYSFTQDGNVSRNSIAGRLRMPYKVCCHFAAIFDNAFSNGGKRGNGPWKLGTAKLVERNGRWALHIPAGTLP